MIHHSQLEGILVRWLLAYLRGRNAACLFQHQWAPYRQVRTGVPQGSVISSALSNYFVSDCPIPDSAMTYYNDDFTLLASPPSIMEAEANQLTIALIRWATMKQLTIAPAKSSLNLFTSDTHQSHLHPQVMIEEILAQLNKTSKILGITFDTHLTFGPHVRNTIERATRALRVIKDLAGAS